MAKGQILGLAHIGLFIQDLERTKKFYTEVLGFEVDYEYVLPSDDGGILVAFLKLGDCCIEAVQFPNAPKKVDGWVDHIALNVKDIEAVKERLIEQGIEFEDNGVVTVCPDCYPPEGSKWILFRGPDGEHLELNERM